jgi:hypothetical protein
LFEVRECVFDRIMEKPGDNAWDIEFHVGDDISASTGWTK